MFYDDPTMAYQNKDTVLQHIRQCYTWKTMYRDVEEYVKTCWKCQQRGSTRQNNVKRTILPMDIFERWGIDIVGPLPLTQ